MAVAKLALGLRAPPLEPVNPSDPAAPMMVGPTGGL
jgi:hypothetical protein